MKRAEIVVIGGGVVGASVAFHLVEKGAKDVLILEREAVQGTGSTGAATGGIRAQFETDINILMSLYSLNFFRECDFECEYEPKGYLFFATSAEQLEYLKRNVEKQRRLGVKDVEIVDAEAIERIVPGMNCEDIAGGSFGRHDGFINPLAVMRGFTEGALRDGAALEHGADVSGLLVERGRITGVETKAGVVECDAAVICTGARAAELSASAGVDLPVVPQRRQIVWARALEALPAEMPMVIDIGTGFHFRSARDFRASRDNGERATQFAKNGGNSSIVSGGVSEHRDILFAYPDPEEKPSMRTDFDDSFIDKVYEKARARAKFLFEAECVRDKCRAGLYENTPDHHAILGACEVGGLYFANGFSGHGVMHSPATGRALAEIILDGEASFLDVSCLSIERFAKGELLHETAFI